MARGGASAAEESDSASDAQSPPMVHPTEAAAYELIEEIGRGVSATVRTGTGTRETLRTETRAEGWKTKRCDAMVTRRARRNVRLMMCR